MTITLCIQVSMNYDKPRFDVTTYATPNHYTSTSKRPDLLDTVRRQTFTKSLVYKLPSIVFEDWESALIREHSTCPVPPSQTSTSPSPYQSIVPVSRGQERFAVGMTWRDTILP